MQSVTSSFEQRAQVTVSEAVDTMRKPVDTAKMVTAETEDLSMDSCVTDSDGGRANMVPPKRQRRHRGADDIFPTRAVQRCQVRV